ncbi:MAG: FGGY-family carbohydrate kinase, partial [Planctomycetales bacterium]
KNIIGLWLVQEYRRSLQRLGEDLDYSQLTTAAAGSVPFRTILDPDHEPFMQPGGMLEKIVEYAEQTRQPVPEDPGQFVRCCLETLALTYLRTFNKLQSVTNRQYDVLHIVGGGGKNELLCQFTADALNRRVVVGPVEATAAGNILTQAMGAGDVNDLDHIRRIVSASFDLKTYQPADTSGWDDAYQRYLKLRGER